MRDMSRAQARYAKISSQQSALSGAAVPLCVREMVREAEPEPDERGSMERREGGRRGVWVGEEVEVVGDDIGIGNN